MVQFWTESKSYAKVQRQWAKHFNLTGRKSKTCVPDRQVIKRAVDRFNDTGSIQVIKKGRSVVSCRPKLCASCQRMRQSRR